MTPKQLAHWRARLQWSMYRSAKALGLSWKTYQHYEDGQNKIPLHVALACCELERRVKEGKLE